MGVRDSAELAAMFIFSEMSEEVTFGEAQEILFASGEVDAYEVALLIDGLCERGILYRTDDAKDAYIGISDKGLLAVEALYEKRESFISSVNKALRVYRRITTGIEYTIDMQKNGKGTDIIFRMSVFGQPRFSTTVYFEDSLEALKAYNRMDNDPDCVYNGFMTVATGKVEYFK